MSASRLRRLWWWLRAPFDILWCRVVGHDWTNVKSLCHDDESREAKELVALYWAAFGSCDYCRRCGRSRGEYAP